MAGDLTKIVRMFSEALTDAEKKKTTAFDTQATVIRVEDKTAWVHIPGGVDETPAQLTIAASPGDVVQVRVSGGRAWLTGNATAPPTDDKLAQAASQSVIAVAKDLEITNESILVLNSAVDLLALSKNSIFSQTTAPAGDHKVNDIWYDSANGYAMHKWDGSQWVLQQYGTDALLAGSVTTQVLATEDVYTNFLLANFVRATHASFNSLSAIAANIGTVNAGILTSSDWDYDYDHTPIYATAGMRISLNDKYIRTPNFAVVNGNLYAQNADIAGKITATSGSISGSLVTSGISATNITTGTLTAIAINNGSGTFSVTSAGALTATSATITGAITATSGNIGGFSIEDNYQIVYRDQMTAGTAGTQYATFMRAQEDASTPATSSTAAFGVVHRSYDGSVYGNWVSDFIVRHDGNVYCYGGALHIEDTSSSSHNGKIQFANAWVGSSASRSLVLHATGDFEASASDDMYLSGDFVSITTGIDGETGRPVGSIAIETATLSMIGTTTINGTLQTSGNINIYNNTATSYAVGVQNSVGKVQLYMSSGGSMGVYDATNSRWIVYEDTSGYINMPRVYANTTTSAVNVVCLTSSGTMYRYSSSSKRYKKNIKPLEDWKKVLDIPVVSFVYRENYLNKADQRYGLSIPGLIAEDVETYYGIAAEKPEGKVEDWNIRYIVPPMLAVAQDHERRITELEERLRKEAV